MGNTPIYGFGYLEPNQDLSENIDLDELRFTAIENQTYNLYQLFKNGIVESDPTVPSWRILTFANEFKLTKLEITSGQGHVSYKAAKTTASKIIDVPLIPSTSTLARVFVYAYENDNTAITGDVDFVASLTQINDSVNYIYLGYVDIQSSTNQITLNDANRQNISLFSSLSTLLKNHKHIGGSANPSPIDLSSEVKNKISSNNIENVDASKITTGILNSSRLPDISHNSLLDSGNLSHEEIESLLLEITNTETTYNLSDLTIANRLQIILALKKQTNFAYIDSTQINSIFYVPGIFPNTDGNSSTGNTANFAEKTLPSKYTIASIGDSTPRTSGSGISGSVISTSFTADKRYVTKNDFLLAKSVASSLGSTLSYYNNVLISGSATTGSYTISTPLNYKTLSQPITSIFDANNNWYSGIKVDTSFVSNKIKLDTKLYTYTLFDEPVSFEQASRVGVGFSCGLGTSTSALGSVYMFLVVGFGNTDPGLLYDERVEFTPNTTGTGSTVLYVSPVENVKIFDDTLTGQIAGTSSYQSILLSSFGDESLKKSVRGFGFYFATDKGWNSEKEIKFELKTPSDTEINSTGIYDDLVLSRRTPLDSASSVFVWNDLYKYKNSNFLIRFDSGDVNTQYNLIEIDVDPGTGTKYTYKSRTDTTKDIFYNFKNVVSSDVIQAVPVTGSNTGRYFDLMLSLYSNEAQDQAPIINSLRINYSAIGSATSKYYDRNETDINNARSGWVSDSYYNKNVAFGSTNPDNTNYLSISDTSKVGNWIYLRNNALISAANNTSETTVEDGIDASTLRNYLSPVQIFLKSSSYGLNSPSDYQALDNGGNIICDTKNDRIIVTDINGNFTKLIQGNIRLKQVTRDFVALSASFNPTTRKIFIAFSQNISFVDLTKLFIVYDNVSVRADDPRLECSYFEPIFGLSATYVISIRNSVEGLTLNSAIQNASVKKIRLDKGSFTNSGASLNTTFTLSASTVAVGVTNTNRTQQFFSGINTSFSGTTTISTGLSATTQVTADVTDFNGDLAVNNTVMYGPNDQQDDIYLSINQGPVHYANLYNPISVQYDEVNDLIVISNAHTNSVYCYLDDADLTLKWTISSDIVKYYDNRLGSAYLLGSGNVLLGSAAFGSSDTGKLQVYNLTNGYVETKLTFNNDVVKALPGPATDYSNFYVLTDDVINNGQNSRLHLVDTSGTIISTWGDNNELFHPKGMRIISNTNILISE